MEQVYIFTLSALFALAIFDLVVGVSNDAVNFLNSAFSSRAARLRTIMIVAQRLQEFALLRALGVSRLQLTTS
ncbi:MAG: hypothetical protein ACFNJP_03515, partial [Capnocytophaga gingivalis]